MKANELMIGDWVIRGNITEEPMRITDICASKNNVYLDLSGIPILGKIDKINPIPLTPEILKKNGFKMAKWKEDEPAGLLGKWWDNRGQVLVKRFDFTLLGEVYSVKANNSQISNIRYVHELQHALRLCGIDKEIVP